MREHPLRWAEQICVGEDYCIPPTFRREHQFRLPTSNHRSDMVLVLCSSDWTPHPHHRESAYLSPLTTGLFGHPQESSVENSKETPTNTCIPHTTRNRQLPAFQGCWLFKEVFVGLKCKRTKEVFFYPHMRKENLIKLYPLAHYNIMII